MNTFTMKKLATVSAVALTLALGAQDALAQDTTGEVDTSITTSNAITATLTDGTDFGTWLIFHDTVNNATLDLASDTGTVTPAVAGGTTEASFVVGAANLGTINIQVPVAANVVMTYTALATDFPGPSNAALTNLNYTFGAASDVDLAAAATATLAAVPAPGIDVDFGGLITFTGTPANGTYQATSTIDFSY